MSAPLPFKTDLPKPRRIMFDSIEWTESVFDEIFRKEPDDLEYYDLLKIFYGTVSMTGFREGLYYLPYAFRELRHPKNDKADICEQHLYEGVVHWLIEMRDILDGDNWLPTIRGTFEEYFFGYWVSSFEFLTSSYPFEIRHSSVVAGHLSPNCPAARLFPDLPQHFISLLAKTRDRPTYSAWFLENIRSFASWPTDGPPDLLLPYCDNKPLLKRHLTTIFDSELFDQGPRDYWDGLLVLL